MTYQLVQTYFASVFFVLVTWLCFLISPDMFEVRVGIAMSTLLTLTAMFASVRDETPKVSYVKAIDIWMVSSIIFIFTALGGFTITAWIKRGLERMQAPKDDDKLSLEILDYKKRRPLTDMQTKKILRKYRRVAIVIEQYGLYILSLAYVIFNIIYWTWLMKESNYLQWSVNSTFNKINE
ncbi:Glycine receptor subunit alphaZ1 [Folsomia candida]|uniref:Glycine receptor subunit alphaZ1 n=2 Tax=Folsomia candida TaxID=158441 RepID=A0A226F441_FOLCA|nr:Glycine receptor subunit alphaZ1 [Folsomia candida]